MMEPLCLLLAAVSHERCKRGVWVLEAHAEHVLYSRVSPAQLLALVASVFQLSQGRAASSLSAMNVPVSSFVRVAKRQTTEAMAWQRRRFALFAPVLSWFGRFEIRTRKVMMSTVREESSLPPLWSRWKLLLNQSSLTCAYQ
jgi:hypothetical protein